MTDFVPSFSNDQLLPPWASKDARLWSFVIRIDAALIQAHLDLYYNSPGPDRAPYHYAALEGPTFGVLALGSHDNFSSMAQSIGEMRTVSHREVYWSFPVRRWRITPDNIIVEPALVWIQPFVFDDNSFVMFSAREICGTEMGMARIALVEDGPNSPLHIDVAIPGTKFFLPRQVSHLLGCIHVELMAGCTPVDPQILFRDRPELAAMADLMASQVRFAGAGNGDAKHAIEVNTLKQFRDVFKMEYAVYRALIASRSTHTNVTKVECYDGRQIDLRFMWSDSMKEIYTRFFGLKEPTEGKDGHPEGGSAIDGHDVDWDMPSVGLQVAFAVASTSDVLFEVLGTLHTYGSL